ENTRLESSAVRVVQGLVCRAPRTRAAMARSLARDAAGAVSAAANDRDAIRKAAAADMVRVARATWQAACAAYLTELRVQAGLFRDIVGNPFRPVVLNPAWQRPEVVVFAEIVYERQAFERLPELGELLEEVGCTHPSLLGHCRQEGSH